MSFLSYPVGGSVGGFDASTTGGWIEGRSPDPSSSMDGCIHTSETRNRNKRGFKGRKHTAPKDRCGGFAALCYGGR